MPKEWLVVIGVNINNQNDNWSIHMRDSTVRPAYIDNIVPIIDINTNYSLDMPKFRHLAISRYCFNCQKSGTRKSMISSIFSVGSYIQHIAYIRFGLNQDTIVLRYVWDDPKRWLMLSIPQMKLSKKRLWLDSQSSHVHLSVYIARRLFTIPYRCENCICSSSSHC